MSSMIGENTSVYHVRPQFGGFRIVLRNGRRIESGWQFQDADLARLIRVAEVH